MRNHTAPTLVCSCNHATRTRPATRSPVLLSRDCRVMIWVHQGGS